VWEETGVPGENPRGRAGDDLTFPHTTPGIKPGSHWREASVQTLRYPTVPHYYRDHYMCIRTLPKNHRPNYSMNIKTKYL